MMHGRFLVGLLLLGFLPTAQAVESTSDLSPQSPSTATKSRTATYAVDFRVAVTAPAKTRQLRVWLPIPPSNDCQIITDRRLETFPRSVEPQIASEPVFGNTFAYFEFHDPDGAVEFRHTFTAQVSQLDWNLDYSKVKRPAAWPAAFEAYQEPDPRSQETRELQQVLTEIKGGKASESDQLIRAMQWVDQNMTYDSVKASLSANPIHALTFRRGHCSDYHGLCGTLVREIGYPSRVLYGLQMFDKGSPSHCKLEVFLPPYGWVTYDLSETQKLAIRVATDDSIPSEQRDSLAEKIKQRTIRGFRENTWLQVTRGVHYELAPPASRSVPIIRTIYAEADGVPLVEPDPSNPSHRTFSWMTMHRVDEQGNAARRFDAIAKPTNAQQ